MLRTTAQNSGEESSRKRSAEEEAEIDQELPRTLPIQLSAEVRKAVDAKVAKYENKEKLNPNTRIADRNRTRLMDAIFKRDYIDFLALVILGADLNKKSSPNTVCFHAKTDQWWTPLMMASYRGQLNMVDLLVKLGVDVNHQSEFGYTAFMLARGDDCGTIRQILVEHGADLTLRNRIDEQMVRERAKVRDRKQEVAGYLDDPRPLPIELSDEEKKAVDAKLAVYKNTENFRVDVYNMASNSHRTRLMQAIFSGDYIDFLALVSLRADLNKLSTPRTLSLGNQSDKEWTPLMMACYRGHLKMVDLLLQCGVNVNHESLFGYTAWSLAQGIQCKEIRLLLVEHGAEPDPPGKTYGLKVKQPPTPEPCPVLALKQEPRPASPSEEEQRVVTEKVEAHKKDMHFNVDARPKPSRRTRLMQAIFDRDIIEFLALLLLGANVNMIDPHTVRRHDSHWSPLMMASYKGSFRMVNELLKRRVDLNYQSAAGYSALMVAAEGNHPEVVKCLLRHGADHRLKTNEGFTALDLTRSYPEIYQEISTILKKHAESQQKLADANSSDLICLIASAPDLDEEEALNNMVIHENSLNQANDLGCTPLHMAVGLGSISFTKALLEKGVAVNTEAFSTKLTPLHIAALQGKEEIAGLLIAAKANPFARDAVFKTPKDCVAEGTPLYKALEVAEREKMRTQTRTLEEILDVSVKPEGVYYSEESNRSSARASSSQASSEKASAQEGKFKC